MKVLSVRMRDVGMLTMLRITPSKTRGTVALKLEGKLLGPWVDELQGYWLGHSRQSERTSIKAIDLAEVSFIDSRGKDLLLRMQRKGVSLIGGSDFIQQLLTNGKAHRAGTHRGGKIMQRRES